MQEQQQSFIPQEKISSWMIEQQKQMAEMLKAILAATVAATTVAEAVRNLAAVGPTVVNQQLVQTVGTVVAAHGQVQAGADAAAAAAAAAEQSDKAVRKCPEQVMKKIENFQTRQRRR